MTRTNATATLNAHGPRPNARSTSSGTPSISISPRPVKAAKRFLGKALKGLKDWEQPNVLNTDKAPT